MVGLLPLGLVLSMRDKAEVDPAGRSDVDPARRYRAESALVDVLAEMPPWPRGAIQRGLLRANTVLVAGFVATDHRACPLASAVWETTGREPASMFQVQLGLAELGLTSAQASVFAESFDEWAIAGGFVRTDADGLRVLTHRGRSHLLRLFEATNYSEARS